MRSDPTAYAFSTLPEILADFASPNLSPKETSLLGWLLVHRGLHLLRVESREQIETEYFAVSKFLGSRTAAVVQKNQPEAFGAWTFLTDLLGEAAKRSDSAAVNSILLDHQGHGKRVLEVLAEAGQAVSRSALRTTLNISESHLSHLLRELEEADLICRHRNGREISIELGSTGRVTVRERVLPQWLDLVLSTLDHLESRNRSQIERSDLERRLMQAGIPSKLAATRVAKAIVGLEAAFADRPGVSSNPREKALTSTYEPKRETATFTPIFFSQAQQPSRIASGLQ